MSESVPLKEYVDKAFETTGRLLEARFKAHDDALKLAADDLRHWRQEQDRFRSQIDELISPISERVRKIESRYDNAAGRFTIISAIVAVLTSALVTLLVARFGQ